MIKVSFELSFQDKGDHNLLDYTTSMHTLVAVLLLTVPVLGQLFSDLNEQWDEWKTKHHKVYRDQDEMVYRRMVWEKNFKLILTHNQEASAGLHTFTMGLNHLADMTTEEFNTQMNGLMPDDHIDSKNVTFKQISDFQVPRKMDWRETGRVSSVKNQGECGACWAFAAAGALEGQMKKPISILIPLSPQNLIDCSTEYGNKGCGGGWIYKAFNYVILNKGINSEWLYPYEDKEGKCRYKAKRRAARCYGYQFIPPGNENYLKHAVATVGPVALAVSSNLISFKQYKGGVYDPEDCDSDRPNHAVLVVGYGTAKDYGTANGKDYWLVKNSWGTEWGEEGYIRMARNKNLCGIANEAVYPIM